MRTYMFGQCARLLDVDPKVFRRWAKEDLGLQERDQVSRADSRARYLTREQLERLADLHERILPDDDAQGKPQHISFASYTLLEDRLHTTEDAQRASDRTISSVQEGFIDVQERLTQVEQRADSIVQWTTLLQGLPAWMKQIEMHIDHLAHDQQQPGHRLAELEAQHRHEIADVEARYQRQIDELEAKLARTRASELALSTPPATKKKVQSRPKHLPRTLVSRSAFAALHHVPDSVVARACYSGKIAATSGKWLYKSRVMYQALGERGQHDFYRLFHTRPDFTPCNQCPHTITQG